MTLFKIWYAMHDNSEKDSTLRYPEAFGTDQEMKGHNERAIPFKLC